MDGVSEKDNELIQEIRDRFDEAFTSWSPVYDEMIDDLNFVNGDQWPEDIKKERMADGRPCLTINKLANFGDQVIGDIRQNEPSIKVKPVDSGSDPDVAEILTGLIKNIEVQSNAEIAYDTAAESSIWCGKGAFRVVTEYSDDDTFDQDIRIKRIKNPFTVFWDPAAQEFDRSDARYCFVTEKIPRDDFKRLYPDATLMDFNSSKDKNDRWTQENTIRIAEYFKKDEVEKNLYLIRDPMTGAEMFQDEILEGWEKVRSRKVKSHKIVWYKTNGKEILEGPTDWPGKLFPICEVWGKEMNIEGESVYRGITRNSKDPQRLYNFSRSSSAELTSLAPKAPMIATAKMIGNYQSIWNLAHKKSFAVLPFDADPALPGSMPKRAEPISQSTAIMQEILISNQELHDTTGLQQANLGQKSNEQSGRAILARQREGDVANFVYYDNLGRAITYCGRIILELIPKIYDTARVVRVLGEDGTEQFVPVNQPVEMKGPKNEIIQKIFDLTVGKYDVVVTIGPGYTTQRDEAAAMMMDFLKAIPTAGPLIGHLVAKNMDFPGAQEISRLLQATLPPQVLGQPAQPQQPDPAMMLEMQSKHADIEGKLLDNRQKRFQAAKSEMGIPDESDNQQQ